jgi:hypothetical protein
MLLPFPLVSTGAKLTQSRIVARAPTAAHPLQRPI